MAEETKKELEKKLKILQEKIAVAHEEEDEEEYKYLTTIQKQTIHMYAGSTLIWQSGSPDPLPPY
jgi:hypothetical protein